MLNEKALLKLMKSAYKGGGLRVARETSRGDRLTLRAGAWAVSLWMDAVPSKVLGLLAEWMRKLPLAREDWLLISGEEPEQQTEPDTVLDGLRQCALEGWYTDGLKPADLTVRGCDVFQLGDGSGEILLFRAELVDLVRERLNMGLCSTEAGTAFWKDEETGEWVWLYPSHDTDRDGLVEHLACFNFWAPKKEARA